MSTKKILLLDILNHETFAFKNEYIRTCILSGYKEAEIDYREGVGNFDYNSLSLTDYKGIIISGSITRYSENAPWKERLINFIDKIYKHTEIPVLALCMSHQLIAHMYGGSVKLNPIKEIGVIKLTLTDEGKKSKLFSGFPECFEIMSSHNHDVIVAPAGSIPLAYNVRCPYQALQLKHIYSIQSHPEFDALTLKKWLLENGDIEKLIHDDYIEHESQLQDFIAKSVYETPYRIKLFENFMNLCNEYNLDDSRFCFPNEILFI